MKFSNLHTGLDCCCIKVLDANINTDDVFSHRLNSDKITYSDFQSFLEQGKEERGDDRKRCMLRGVSIDLYNDESKEFLKERYKSQTSITVGFKPKAVKYYCVFKLNASLGKVASTSNSKNKYHHTLLKSDDFNRDHIIVIDIEKIC